MMSKVAQTLGLAPKMPTVGATPAATPTSAMPTVDPTSEIQKARKKQMEKSQTGREGTRLSDAGTQSYANDLLGT
jgi:hypothetical protein